MSIFWRKNFQKYFWFFFHNWPLKFFFDKFQIFLEKFLSFQLKVQWYPHTYFNRPLLFYKRRKLSNITDTEKFSLCLHSDLKKKEISKIHLYHKTFQLKRQFIIIKEWFMLLWRSNWLRMKFNWTILRFWGEWPDKLNRKKFTIFWQDGIKVQ